MVSRRSLVSLATALILVVLVALPAFAQSDAESFVLDDAQIPSSWSDAGTWVYDGSELIGSGMIFDDEAYQRRLVEAGFGSAIQQDYSTPDGYKSYIVLVFSDEVGPDEMVRIAQEEGYLPADPLCGGPAWVHEVPGVGRSFFTVHGAAVFAVETDTPGDADDDPFVAALCPLMADAEATTGDAGTTATTTQGGDTTPGSAAPSSEGSEFPFLPVLLALLGLSGLAYLFRRQRLRLALGGAAPPTSPTPPATHPPTPTGTTTAAGVPVSLIDSPGPLILDETAQIIEDPLPEQQTADDQPDDRHRSAFVTLDTDKTTVRPEGDSISLTATARYDDWSPVPGRTVTFGPVDGVIAPPSGVSGPDGIVLATFTPSPTTGGQIRLVAMCEGSEGFAGVTVQRDEPTELDLAVTPRRLQADGKATANLAAEVFTERLKPAVGVTVRFEDDAGGRIEPPSAVTDQSGTARAAYTMPSETDLGHVTITATAEAATPRPELTETRTIKVVVPTLELTVDRDRIPPGSGERVWVTAQLTDDEQQPVSGERLIAEVTEGDGSVYPESATTGAEGTAEISYIPGDRMGPIVITVRHETIADLESSVDIDQSAPNFETTDGSGPMIRVLLTEEVAAQNMGIEFDDVIGVQVLDPSGTAWTGGVSPDAFLVAAFIAEHGVRKDDYYTEAADGLDRRADAAREGSSRLSGLATRSEKRIDQAAWLQAIHDDYYKPIEELAVAAVALLGLYLLAKLALVKAGAVLAAKVAALGPAKAISATALAKIKAQAAVAGAAEFISLPTLKEIGEKVVVDGLKWVKGKLVTDFDELRHQHGLLLTQATIFDRLAPTAQRSAETWQKVGHTGGPSAEVRSLLALNPDSVTWSLQQVDQEMRSAERDRLIAFGADAEAMTIFEEEERRRDEAREESRTAAQTTHQMARSLEEMWRSAMAKRGGS